MNFGPNHPFFKKKFNQQLQANKKKKKFFNLNLNFFFFLNRRRIKN